ncbi:DUF4397 domain-containing protein [Chitinophaga sp. S165]|uniref:DUF4397 domain-containing protein n=1 Tax=Chitinophaga sp. S165 TaxID=2135462 RepID=UPI000D71AD0E|nr:DUF4397 domain-containing protein [Chitinophaga sp. S165]PWV50555.1 uncharacterized protein DUF4397 [Chitinophaga sp. S165]
MKQRLYLILLVIITGVIACSKDSDSSIPDTSSNINVFFAIPDKQYDVLIDTTTIGTDLGYGQNTGYHSFQAKRYSLVIYPAGNRTTPVGGGEVSLRNGHYYSVFLSQNINRIPQLLLVEDKMGPSQPNFGKVRFINLSDTWVNTTSRLTMDVYVDSLRYFRRQGYLAVSEFAEVPAGTRYLDLIRADSALKPDWSVIGSNSHNYVIEAQKQYTIIGYGDALKKDSFKLTTFEH